MSGTVRHPMSTIQEYRGIVHMMQGGYLNGDTGTMAVNFYRCATYIGVTLRTSDFEGTPFAATMAPHMIEPTTLEEQVKHLYQTPERNAFLIDYLFPTLDELAPHHGREWSTLEDILTTPRYELSLHRPSPSDDHTEVKTDADAVVRVDKGPIIHSALDVLQTRFDTPTLNIDTIFAATMPWIPASDITFTEDPIESHTVPKSVVVPTGETVDLIVTGRTIHNMDAGRVTNPSHFAIKTYLETHRLLSSQSGSFRAKVGVQEVLAIVTTQTPPPSGGLDCGAPENTVDVVGEGARQTNIPENTYLAGILLKPLPDTAKPLNDPSIISLASSDPSLAETWRASLLQTLSWLHDQTPLLYHGNLWPSAIYICHSDSENTSLKSEDFADTMSDPVYLIDFSDNLTYDNQTPETELWTPQGDLTALENIFGEGGWLQKEAKKFVEGSSHNETERKDNVVAE